MIRRRLSALFLLLGILGLTSVTQARADTYPISGNFAADNSVFDYTFNVATNSLYTFATTSYAAGGFVPYLTLFNSAGTVVGFNGASGMCLGSATADKTSGMCDDAYLQSSLTKGTYSLFLTEFPNVATGTLSQGFLFAGNPTITGDLCGVTGGKFLQTDTATCLQRGSNYAGTVTSTAIGVTPEPSSWLMLLPAMGLLVVARYRTS